MRIGGVAGRKRPESIPDKAKDKHLLVTKDVPNLTRNEDECSCRQIKRRREPECLAGTCNTKGCSRVIDGCNELRKTRAYEELGKNDDCND